MTKEYISQLEEIFVERFFELGEDCSTLNQNYTIAKELYQKSLIEAIRLAEDISNGVIVDESNSIYVFQNTIFSFKYMGIFKEELVSLEKFK